MPVCAPDMATEGGAALLPHLPQVRGRYQVDVPLSSHTWFRVGGKADVVFKPADHEDLALFLKHKPTHVPYAILGVGSNILVRDGGFSGVVIRLGPAFAQIIIHDDNTIDVGAGALDRTLACRAADRGCTGFEFLSGIPGMMGGALRMNAGAYGTEIKDRFVFATAIDPKGRLHRLSASDMGFSYRHSDIPKDWIFIAARLQGEAGDSATIHTAMETLLASRDAAQPVRARTGGSTFANPQDLSAWKLIDQAGCRGLQRGGAQVSSKHCNFLINTGSATATDLEDLGNEVQKRVFETSGVMLRWEIERIGSGDV